MDFVHGNVRWMNGHYLRGLPSNELIKVVGERWKSTGILNESEGHFIEVCLFWKQIMLRSLSYAAFSLQCMFSYQIQEKNNAGLLGSYKLLGCGWSMSYTTKFVLFCDGCAILLIL